MSLTVCPPYGDQAFGPRVDPSCRSFDFTLLFEDIFFACLPAAVFLTLLPSHVNVLANRPVVCSLRSKLLLSKLVSLIGLFAAQIAFLVLRCQDATFKTNVGLVADVLSVVGTAAAAWLSFLDHQRSCRPSTLLSLYLSLLVILDIARVRTLWLMDQESNVPAAMTAVFALTLTTLLAESIEKRSSVREEKRGGAPEEYSGFWIRTAYAWVVATFRIGYSKIISLDDLPKLDTGLRSELLREKLVMTWDKYDHRERHSLVKACFRSHLLSFLSGVIPRLCNTVFSFTQPFLISTTVTYVGTTAPDASYGKGLIGAWALVFLGMACSGALYNYQLTRFITRLRGGLVGLVYQETMRLRTVDLGDTTAVALMGTDIERIGQSLRSIHEIWASPIEVGVGIWLLERQVSLACIAPVIIIVVFVAAMGPVTARTKVAQREWIEKVQKRLAVTSSMLDDMKAVKMLGLSRVMSTIVQGLRRSEIETSKAYRKLLVWMILLSNTPINLAPVATFAVYVIISLYWRDDSLLAAKAFTSVTLVNLLTTPVLIFIQSVPSVIQSVGSFDRIQEYCNSDTLDIGGEDATEGDKAEKEKSVSELQTEPGKSQTRSVAVESQSFSWDKSKPAFLKNISLQAEGGEITMVVGPVGSGKSTLLESLLGETIGSTTTPDHYRRSIAYCAQQPWLENGTIRSNILGVAEYDRQWYRTVIAACGLETDLKQLDKGDMTIIGSKGLNLSGGQKQRIALARAIYSRTGIVFLDDVFSGMDARTVETVSRDVLGKAGLFRKQETTVVMATHSHKLMGLADKLVALDDGKIVEIGRPEVLLSNGGYVAKLGLELADEDEVEPEPKIEAMRIESVVTEPRLSTDLTEEANSAAADARRKNGDLSVYKYYVSSSGKLLVFSFIFGMAIWLFLTEFSTVWLDWWSAANATEPNKDVGMYMGMYAFFGLFGVAIICIVAWLGFVNVISNSAFHLHSDLLEATLRAPFRFFTITDTGSLTNRFSQDMELIDMNLPMYMTNFLSAIFSTLSKGIILIVYSKYLAVTVPFVAVALYFLQSFYLQTSRQVRLLEIEAKAPLYTHFTESVAGAATIRAFGWQSRYQERNCRFIDSSQRPAYLQYCIQHWLSFVLDMMVMAIAVLLVAIVITWRDKFSAGSVGVSLTMVITFSTTLMRLIQMWTMMESSVGAVARVKRFVADTESEETGQRHEPPKDWPQAGQMDFSAVVASHSPDSDPVIKGVTMSVKAGEHVAICGRSGSGKTSLILAVLQMIETRGGQISVDGVDVAGLTHADVRGRLNVVPQDPFLVPGTVRFNIDPFGGAQDADIVRALERVRLWDVVREQGGLDKEMDTAAWSAGQRQLLCLARAMVRGSRVLILDEATSSVDSETEIVMQGIIDTEFKGCTVLAVMHRLKHIHQYDKVALLDSGFLLEFDKPQALLERESSFAELYQSHAK